MDEQSTELPAAAPAADEPVGDLRLQLQDLRRNLRRGIGQIDDPQGKALLEVSAEVIGGLMKAFDDYHQKAEPAWRLLARRIFP